MNRAAIWIAAIFTFWAASYASGEMPWIGGAWLSRQSFGAGPIAIIGEDRRGTEWGFDSFVFFAGQEIVVDYDVEVRGGSLWMHVFRPYDGTLGDGPSKYVTESGHGTWTVPVTTTAVYHITVEPSPTHGEGRGWDLSYSATWGGRPAGPGAAH